MTAVKASAPGDLDPGDTVAHFEILGRLGKGGMGTVYRARDRKLDRAVALKFLPSRFTSGPGATDLLREARTASALDHPNVCTVYTIDKTADGRAFIAMAAYEGETVQERLQRDAMPPSDLVDVALQTARGLAAAHGQGTAHLDVKPANLMITRDGLVKVLDFGLSKAVGGASSSTEDEESDEILGTLPYMSPEQVRGRDPGTASDIWSLGAVMFEMATGRPPFGTDASTADRILDEDTPDLRNAAQDIPKALARIVHKALSKDLSRRYRKMSEMITDLEALGPLARTSRSRKARPASWALPAAFLALLAVLGGWWLTKSFFEKGQQKGLPRDPQAQALLVEATRHLRQMDGQAALEPLTRALRIESENPAVHSALAEASRLLGRERETLEHSEKAFALALGLPAEVRLLYEARLARSRRDDETSADLMEGLWESLESRGGWDEGERLDFGLELIQARIRTGRDAEARQLIQRFHTAGHSEDPRLALTSAMAASNWQEHLEAAQRAGVLAESAGTRVARARARFAEGRASRYLGDLAAARAALEDSAKLYAELGHSQGEADALTTLGNLYWDQNELTTAKTLYEQAATLYGAIGNSRLRARPLTNKALVLLDLGDLEAAVEIFREALTEQRQFDDRLGQVYTLVNLAGPLVTSGKLDEAAEAYRQASDLVSELQDPGIRALVLESSGELHLLRGDLDQARTLLEQARHVAEGSGDRQALAQAGFRLGRLSRLQGDLETARQLSEEALAIVEELGDDYSASLLRHDLGQTLLWSGDLAGSRFHLEQALAIQEEVTDLSWSSTRLSLAELLLAEDAPGRAEELARQSCDSFERRHWIFDAASGYEILARSLLAQRMVEAAEMAIGKASELLSERDTPIYYIPIALTAGAVAAEAGQPDRAREILQSALAEATTHGFVAWELHARLALAELDITNGNLRTGRARLRRVADEAKVRGFGLIARRALARAP